jgi:EPS-associated MarR family transcriptional regulator
MKEKQEYLDILRKIKKEPRSSQRNLSKNLGMSLGKLNYCLNSLKKKGLIKIKNFKNNPNKMKYAYIITPKGITLKTKLTINFMKRKMSEYDELKKELNSNKKEDLR